MILSSEKIRNLILKSLLERMEQTGSRVSSYEEYSMDSDSYKMAPKEKEVPGVGVMINPDAKFAFPVPVSGVNSSILPARNRAGSSSRPTHSGEDWRVPEGTAVIAVADGVVASIQKSPGSEDRCGCRVSLNVSGLGRVIYCHLNQVSVAKGDNVTRGQVIGLSGGRPSDPCAGSSTGPHLHFSLGQSTDQSLYDSFYSQCTGFRPAVS